MNPFWQGKKVFITGHTGFKGSWLSLWLLRLGAQVTGLSLEPETQPALFTQLGLTANIDHYIEDIRDLGRVKQLVAYAQPDVVFHLAAQPLVRRSYLEPVATWETNVMGTIHVMEALKQLNHSCAAVFITTDKCYENREWTYGYRESDSLGGYDPYSSSKAAAELTIASWRRSFFQHSSVGIASVRAGNVIGGGDWATDRIVPDAVRALTDGQTIPVRNPGATRPWQHVLEPLGGYLLLAQRIYEESSNANGTLCSAFNFGPALDSNRPVRELVEAVLKHWPGTWTDYSDPNALHEASLLNLVTDKAFHTLGWQPTWNFERTMAETVSWYRQASELLCQDVHAFRQLTLTQIERYEAETQWWPSLNQTVKQSAVA